MEKFRSRCHFSIIFQSIWQFWAVILIFLLQQLDSLVELLRDFDINQAPIGGLVTLGGLILVSLVIFAIQFLRWRKTWIIIKDNLIIYERNTLNKKKKTMALETVSTVNIERNLFDRIVGTCRIKMDTNSMTTAKETDINILLKEDKALEFKTLVMSLIDGIDQLSQPPAEEDSVKTSEETTTRGQVYTTSLGDLVMHWIYTIPVTSTLITLVGIVFAIGYIATHTFESFIAQIMGSFIAAAIVVVGAFFNVIKQLIGYYNFSIFRDGDDIYIKHGLIKLREYTVPITKINAITIDQPPVARLFKKYTVKVSTVGLGDDDNEDAYLSMAMSKEKMLEQMAVILPEYGFEEMLKVTPEEKVGMKVRMFLSIKWHLILLGIAPLIYFAFEGPLWAAAIPVALDLFINLLYLLSHKAAGYTFTDNGFTVASGYFAKHYTLCSFGKMEYIRLGTHPASKICNVCNGVIYMLDHFVELPYVKRELAQKITSQMIETKRLV